LKFKFKNISCLNTAINKIWATYDKSAKETTLYVYSGKTFKKLFDPQLIKDKTKISNKEKEVLSEAKYTMIYRFQNEINTYSNNNALLSKSRKAIIVKSKIYPVI